MNQNTLKLFGDRVFKARKKLGMSQAELADKLTNIEHIPNRYMSDKTGIQERIVSQNYVLRIERGQRKYITPAEAEWLAEALGESKMEFASLVDPEMYTLVMEIYKMITQNHPRSSFFSMPACNGDEMHASPQLILLYICFLMETEGRLHVVKRDFQYNTLCFILLILGHFIQVKNGELIKRPFRLTEAKDLINEYCGAFEGHSTDVSNLISVPKPEIIHYLQKRISIYTLRVDKTMERSILYNLSLLNPTSYFTFVPFGNDLARSSYYSFGVKDFGKFRPHDSDLIHQRFQSIRKNAESEGEYELLPIDEVTIEETLKVAENWGFEIRRK